MTKITLEIPDELVEELERFGDRSREIFLLGLSQLKIQEALLLYERGVVSFARGAELADVSRDVFALQARARGLDPRWTEDTLDEEIA